MLTLLFLAIGVIAVAIFGFAFTLGALAGGVISLFVGGALAYPEPAAPSLLLICTLLGALIGGAICASSFSTYR